MSLELNSLLGAVYNLSQVRSENEDVTRIAQETIEFLEKKCSENANSNNPSPDCELAMYYIYDKGVSGSKPDKRTSLKYLWMAAMKDNTDAQYLIGKILFYGEIAAFEAVKKDTVLGFAILNICMKKQFNIFYDVEQARSALNELQISQAEILVKRWVAGDRRWPEPSWDVDTSKVNQALKNVANEMDVVP